MQRNKLNLLPDQARKKLNQLIADGFGDKVCKKEIEREFSGQTPVLPVSRNTYRAYICSEKNRSKGHSSATSTH